MPEREQLVKEFREVCDTVILNQVEAARAQRRSWPGYDKVAKIAGLTFVSVNKADMRPAVFGAHSEHIWGAMLSRTRHAGHVGSFAIASEVEQTQGLVRRWSFVSAMQALDVRTSRVIDDPHEIKSALRWIRSPHLSNIALGELAVLGTDETAYVEAELDKLAARQNDLQRDLDELARQRRQPLPDEVVIL